MAPTLLSISSANSGVRDFQLGIDRRPAPALMGYRGYADFNGDNDGDYPARRFVPSGASDYVGRGLNARRIKRDNRGRFCGGFAFGSSYQTTGCCSLIR